MTQPPGLLPYLLSTVLLLAVAAAFFLLSRRRFHSFGRAQFALRLVVALPLAVSGVGHFVKTGVYASIVPPFLPHPAFWVLATGLLELAGAIGLLVEQSARTAAVCVALLMVAVFPANVYAAHRTVGGLPMPGIPARLLLQAAYLVLVLLAGWGMPGSVRRGGARRGAARA